MSKGVRRKWGGKSLQNLFLNSKENMKQQHIASVNSPATVLEPAVYIHVLPHRTQCIALDSSPEDRTPAQLGSVYPREVFRKKKKKDAWAALWLQLHLAEHSLRCLVTEDVPT